MNFFKKKSRYLTYSLGLSLFFCTVFFTGNVFAQISNDSASTTVFVEDATSTATVSTSSADVSPWEQEESHYEMNEPIIRVGIYKTDKKVQFISPFAYDVVSGGERIGRIPENQLVTLTYDNGVYNISSLSLNTTSDSFVRLIPDDVSNYFSIFNLDRHLVTRSHMNFASFRGIMEYRYSPKSKMPYIINELLLEDYVSGVGETSNDAPEEYVKALQIAARTYAFTNIGPNSSDNRMFDVYASTVDQLYLGYNFEQFNPKIAFFTAGTRGMMVTFKDKPVTTYYYSRSNGKTKTKAGVPWLKSVVCKYDKGYRQLGHGYGMSNRDAAMRAKKDKWKFDKILTYYYSGTKVQKMYE